MRVEWVRIKGFRNFNDETIYFKDKTLIIGGNDVGKSNLVHAMRLLLDRSLSLRDLELNDNDYNAYTQDRYIEITLKLSDITEDCLLSTFVGDIKDGAVFLQYKNSKDGEMEILTGQSLDLLEAKQSRFYLRRLNMEYVDTNRDLNKFIKREKQNLLKFSKNDMSDQNQEEDRKKLEIIQGKLDNLNEEIDSLVYINNSLERVNKELQQLAINNENQRLKFASGNSDVGELLSNIELSFSDGNKILKIGGDGRNNQIFLATWIAKQKIERNQEKVTIFAIEEPEAHLHPHQQRKLSKYLTQSFDSQIFITTHSPQIASEFKPDGIVRLYSENRITKAANRGCSKDIQLSFEEFGYRLNVISSEMFFSNGVYLVEGPSEIIFYRALAEVMGFDLDFLNISIIAVDGVGFKPYIKICKALSIPFVMRTDNDVFTRTIEGEKFEYFAGISRVIGIYKELIANGTSDSLIEYWEENYKHNNWLEGSEMISHKTNEVCEYMKNELKKHNLFLSICNLEEDLIDSQLITSLQEYYEIEDSDQLLIEMQKRKAENMLSYLEYSMGDLVMLNNDDIMEPLLRLKEIVEKGVKSIET